MLKVAQMIFVLAAASNAFAVAGKVSFSEPKDGATVEKTFHVKMQVDGRKICAAGAETADKTCGHHHIVVDGGPIPLGQVVPTDATHLHYGKGQEEADITLSSGKHKLTLQFADFAHRSYGETLSQTITVNVK